MDTRQTLKLCAYTLCAVGGAAAVGGGFYGTTVADQTSNMVAMIGSGGLAIAGAAVMVYGVARLVERKDSPNMGSHVIAHNAPGPR